MRKSSNKLVVGSALDSLAWFIWDKKGGDKPVFDWFPPGTRRKHEFDSDYDFDNERQAKLDLVKRDDLLRVDPVYFDIGGNEYA